LAKASSHRVLAWALKSVDDLQEAVTQTLYSSELNMGPEHQHQLLEASSIALGV